MVPTLATRKDIARYLGLEADEAASLAWDLRHAQGDVQEVDAVLADVNILLEGHGIEAIPGEADVWVNNYYQNILALYVNMGDTYTDTLIYDTEAERFLVGAWGDWMEGHEGDGDLGEPQLYSPKDWSPRT